MVCLYNEILNKIVKWTSGGDKDVKIVSYTKCSKNGRLVGFIHAEFHLNNFKESTNINKYTFLK